MVLGAAIGALAAVLVNDRLGRLRAWQLSTVIYIVGLFIQVFSSGIYGLLLFARIFSGLGAGALTVIAPLYLSEIAPARTRGLIVSVYMVLLLTILTLGVYPDAKRER
jgi:MFS family permease